MLTPKERDTIGKVLAGRLDPNKGLGKKILSRPECAVALEHILDQQGLTDTKLTKRIRQIINRKAEIAKNKYGSSTNQSTVDNNALNAIKTIWQAKGKFTEKHDVHHSGELTNLSDKQLDTLIEQGTSFLVNRKNKLN